MYFTLFGLSIGLWRNGSWTDNSETKLCLIWKVAVEKTLSHAARQKFDGLGTKLEAHPKLLRDAHVCVC